MQRRGHAHLGAGAHGGCDAALVAAALAVVVVCGGVAGCAAESEGDGGGGQAADVAAGGAADTDATSGGDAAGGDAAASDATANGGDGASDLPQPPAPFEYSGGMCPKLAAGENEIYAWSKIRKVDLYLPPTPQGAGLLYLWHGLGDSKENFGYAMGAATLAKLLNAVVAVPQSEGKVAGWGWADNKDALEDATLFDDLLNCIDGQYDIDNSRVYTMGFSAGGLWSSWLVLNRSSFLASAVIWSGGSGEKANVYKSPKRQLPVLMAWGGKEDQVLVNFEDMTKHMASKLLADGHYVLLCNHNSGHTIPPTGLQWAVTFLNAHTFATTGKSPIADDDAKKADFPGYCTFP